MAEYSRDQHRADMRVFVNAPDPALKGKLDEALYTMSELGLWPDDVDRISVEQALACWKIVEKLRVEDFPAELRM